jgi:hypothetical protein
VTAVAWDAAELLKMATNGRPFYWHDEDLAAVERRGLAQMT